MKKLFFIITIFCAIKTNAQPYSVSFAGTGAATSISSVKVENLTTSLTATLNSGDVLHLSGTIGIYNPEIDQRQRFKIYPNPMSGTSVLQIVPPEKGNIVITIYDITGRSVFQSKTYLENYLQEFRLSGINTGLYIITVKGDKYRYSKKLLVNNNSDGIISMDKISDNKTMAEKKSVMNHGESGAVIYMAYNSGERLKYTGISGIYRTIVTDIPSADTTITFNFYACTDGDNNNYPVVKIGQQVWIAENLKTTKFNNGQSIPLVQDNQDWCILTTPAFCWYNNDENSHKATYGALYNWYAVNNKNLCPVDWHVPTDAEWTALTNFLGDNSVAGGQLKETGTGHWIPPNVGATNLTGFTALPGGSRVSGGAYSNDMKENGYWWSATESDSTNAWSRSMNFACNCVPIADYIKKFGFSVRCLKD